MDCISDVRKFFTRDQYDHIALVVINEGELEILEATSNEKCNLLKNKANKILSNYILLTEYAANNLKIQK